MSLHPYQGFISKNKLHEQLRKTAVEVVNLVGLDINEILKCEHTQKQLQFINGLGPRKAYSFLESLKSEGKVTRRAQVEEMVSGPIVYKNCVSFFKIETSMHRPLLDKM